MVKLKRHLISSVCIFACSFFINAALASTDPIPHYQTIAAQLKLAEESQWLSLLHIKNQISGPVGQAKTASFYLSPTGRTSAEAELNATLAAMFSPDVNENHALCRFPARADWLKDKLSIPTSSLPQPNCNALNQFLTNLKPAGVTLVFPVAYLNSPSSMFGHTFLRIDQVNQTETTRLLAWSINYAANPNMQDGEVVFAWKGLFGGYPGAFSMLPYYLKVKEYNDWESRDVWEFKLDLTQRETEQLSRHVWELMNVDFDYYFLTKNCSYRVLELLDVVRPQHQLAAEFEGWAIPVDTVRAVQKAQMTKDAVFRPSAMKLVRNGLQQLTEAERQLAYELAVSDENSFSAAKAGLDALPRHRQSAVLEVAYEYQRLSVQLNKLSREETASRSLWLLRERSKITGLSPLKPVAPPSIRDDQAHESSRVSLTLGKSRDYWFQDLSWRPAFHSLNDPYEGFPPGAQIKFLETHFRNWQTSSPDSFELERLDIISVTALTQHDQFFQPWSWQVNVGARRQEVSDAALARPLVGFFDFTGGLTKYVSENVSAYALAGGALEAGHEMDDGFDVAPVIELGVLGHYQAGIWPYAGQWQFNVKRLDWAKSEHAVQRTVALSNTFNLTRNSALQFIINRNQRFELWSSEAALGLALFF